LGPRGAVNPQGFAERGVKVLRQPGYKISSPRPYDGPVLRALHLQVRCCPQAYQFPGLRKLLHFLACADNRQPQRIRCGILVNQ
jgi:hypothetical protein